MSGWRPTNPISPTHLSTIHQSNRPESNRSFGAVLLSAEISSGYVLLKRRSASNAKKSPGGSLLRGIVYSCLKLLPCTHLYSETCTFFDSHSSLFFFRLFPLFSGSRTPLILSLFLHFTVPDAFNFLLLLFFFLPCRQELISCSDSFSDAVFFLPTNEKCGEWK